MSESVNPEPSRLANITAIASGGTSGLIGGVAFTNELLPPNVQLAPGVAADASLKFGDTGVTGAYGPTSVHAPDVATGIPAGVKVDFTQFNIPLGSHHGIDNVAALVSHFDSSVAEPVKHALMERLALGGSLGMVAGSYLGYKALKYFRETSLAERVMRRPRQAAAIALAACAVLGGCASHEYGLDDNDALQSPKPAALNSIITKQVPALKGATVSGTGGEVVNTLAYGAVDYITSVNDFWQQSAHNFKAAYSAYKNKYAQDPNNVAVVHLSDLHCNYANLEHYLGPVLRELKAPIIVSTGDTFTNSGKMPYEKDCFADLVDDADAAAQANEIRTTVINVAGNHDDKEPIDLTQGNTTVTTLSKKQSSATVDGITFVGAEDPRVTIWYPTLPSNPVEAKKALIAQGHAIAATACKITAEKDEAPVVLSHSDQASYETIAKGCASVALNGHTHHNSPIKRFIGENGNTVLQHTVGSASGADVGLTILERPKQDASMTVNYFNKQSREFVGFITVILRPDGTIAIKEQKPQAKASTPEAIAMQAFVERYSAISKKQSGPITLLSRGTASHPGSSQKDNFLTGRLRPGLIPQLKP